MAKIRFSSDHHNDKIVGLLKRPTAEDIERSLFFPRPQPDDKDTVMVLAGDLWEGTKSLKFGPANYSWIGQMADRFKAVVVVLGNHDLWGETIPRIYEKFDEMLAPYPNVHLLEAWLKRPSVVVDGVRFVGGTLWTDMDKGNPEATHQFDYALGMDGRKLWNDRNYIRVGPQRKHFSSMDAMAIHRQTVKEIARQVGESQEPVILVTHMAPTWMSSSSSWMKTAKACDKSSAFYASDLSDLLLDNPKIKLSIHGHIHETSDYQVGDGSRVVCNPRGYIGAPNPHFKEDWVIEVPADINFQWNLQSQDFSL